MERRAKPGASAGAMASLTIWFLERSGGNMLPVLQRGANEKGQRADSCGAQRNNWLLADTAFLGSNGAEGGIAVEPEAVFHGWLQARRECLPGGTQWSESRAGATCRSG